MLLTIDWLAVGVGHHKTTVNDAVPAFSDLAGKISAWSPDLNRDLVDFAHAMLARGYSIGRFHLSLNDLVLANLSETTAYLVALNKSSSIVHYFDGRRRMGPTEI